VAVARTTGVVPAAPLVLPAAAAADPLETTEAEDEEEVIAAETVDAVTTPAGTSLAKDGGALATASTRAPVPQGIDSPSGCVLLVGVVVAPEEEAMANLVVHCGLEVSRGDTN